MADCKRLVTLKRLTTYLEQEVTLANGYEHDLAGCVFRGRYRFGATDPVTFVAILESMNPDRFPRDAGDDDGRDAPTQLAGFPLLIQGWGKDDPQNPTDPLYNLMADVKKALAKILRMKNPQFDDYGENYMLGGLITGMTMEPGTVRPMVEQSSDTVCFYLHIVLKFVEDLNDPYKLD